MTTKIQRRATYTQSNSQDWLYDQLLANFLFLTISDILTPRHEQPLLALDIGCGEQPLRSFIEDRGAEYKSTDISQNQLSSVDYIVDISSPSAYKAIPYQFDLILLSEVLEHVPNPEIALQNAMHLLAPGGKLVITTPFLWPLHEQPHDFQRLTKYWFYNQIESLGLRLLVDQSLGSPTDVLITILLKTHMFSVKNAGFQSLLPRLYAFLTRCIKSGLICILKKHDSFSLECSSGFYLINCLVISD